MNIKQIWISNQPDGIGFDATENYLRAHAEAITPIVRSYNAAIIGQSIIMDGDDDDFDDALDKITAVLNHGDDDDEDETPVFAEYRSDGLMPDLQHALIIR